MRRALTLSGELLLIASILLSAAVSGYLRASHELAYAGHNTIVFCGQDGVRAITRDLDGNPIKPGAATGEHCADCFVGSIFGFPVTASIDRGIDPDSSISNIATDVIRVAHRIQIRSHGPPVMNAV